jgi:error-prone DNA polymerase
VYIELHAASAFSFLDGASTPEALVDRAAALGYPALALVDRDGVYGAPRFHMAAKAAGLKAIVGVELTMAGTRDSRLGQGSGGLAEARRAEAAGLGTRKTPQPILESAILKSGILQPPVPSPQSLVPAWSLPVLVATREGYRNLCRLVTRMKLRAPKGEGALALEDLEGRTAGLIALVGRPALAARCFGVGGLVDRLVGLFGRDRVYVELQRHGLRDEESDNQALVELASAFHVPVVAANGVRFAAPEARPLFDVFTCLRHKTTIARAGRRLSVNAERYLKPAAEMAALFADRPRAVAASCELADRIEFTMANLGYRFPDYPVPEGETQASFLRKITEVGARERYRPYHERARRQIAHELDLIEKLQLAGYFLIVWDIVNFCRQQGILAQGRGSAANSAVCYSLGITAVDPVGMELLFERFLSEERGEWPDIDLDLPSGDRRERVIQYVYERYGKLGAGMTANVITYRGKSAAREVGKVLGLEAESVDRLAKAMSRFEFADPEDTLDRHLRDVGFDPARHEVRLFADLWRRMQDLPRHLGQHSGGMVICQGRLDEVVPLENAAMPGRVVIQWDKEDCADMGIVKVDLLGLGMMAVLQDALEVINGVGARRSALGAGHRQSTIDNRQSAISNLHRPFVDLAHLPPDDPAVYRMLQEADTIGVFQVESRAQMATLPRLRPACFYDLVVEVAIIRPGPIVGQMVHPYLRRRQGSEPVVYPHPALEPVLRRTLGVPLFQEQLLRMAMVVAGFSGGEAEELRRAMGFKRSVERMRKIEEKLRAGMARQGITGEAADSIVRSISSFALYGFPESHAASFALLVYASAYLKEHYPAAFYAAMLNNQPMGFYHPATLVKDAQRHGVQFAPIDVQRSGWLCAVEPDGRVRLGLRYVAGLREEVGLAIEAGGLGTEIGMRGQRGERRAPSAERLMCPKCGCDDPSMLEIVETAGVPPRRFCNVCAHDWDAAGARYSVLGTRGPTEVDPLPRRENPEHSEYGAPSTEYRRFSSPDDLIAKTGVRRDELATLAEIGALESFGHDRRGALWQIERAIRPAGELFEENGHGTDTERTRNEHGNEDGIDTELTRNEHGNSSTINNPPSSISNQQSAISNLSPLRPMSPLERVAADYDGTGLTIGPHPMAFRRRDLALRGVVRASDLPRGRHGRRVRVAGAVITRQRPGTAKGFVFLTLEDETGIANIIVQPDLFAGERLTIVSEPYLMIEGTLQIQDGVTSVKAERVRPLGGEGPAVDSHDFY